MHVVREEMAMKFILNLESLNPGDIILEHCYHPDSARISRILESHYSHAMIFTGEKLLEATPDRGVFSRVPNRFAFATKEDIKVMRLKEPLTDRLIEAIDLHASVAVGSSYNKVQAIKSALPKKPDPEVFKGQFCSRLVAQSYAHAGINLVENINYCTPGDLERSNLLYSVDNAVKIATPEEIEHALGFSIHDEHAAQTKQWVDEAKGILGNHKQYPESISDIFNSVAILKNRKVESLIANAIIKSEYYNFYLKDKEINPYRYDDNLFSLRVSSEEEVNFEIKKENGIIKRHSLGLKNSKINHKIYSNILIKNDIELNRNVLSISLHRLRVIYGYCVKMNLPSHAKKANEMMKKIRKALS